MEERLAELEVRIAFQDRLLAELDDVIRSLRDEMDRLQARIAQIEEHVEPDRSVIVDEPPPHW